VRAPSRRTVSRLLLSGRVADDAREVILAIADQVTDAVLDPLLGPAKVVDLAHGKAGRAVFFEYLARATGNASFSTRSSELLDEALEALAEISLKPSLYYGFSGVAWAHQHLGGDVDLLDPIDEALLEHISIDPWSGRCDVAVGLAGYGVYFLSRPRTPIVEAALDQIEHHLVSAASSDDAHVWWPLPTWIATLPLDTGALGMGGIVSFLASAWPRLGSPARALLPKALSWLWDHLDPRLRSSDSNEAWWCEPAIAMAILRASRRLDSAEWWERGLLLARNLARGRAADTSFYRGVSGVAHMLHRVYRATRDETIEKAAQIWFQRLLEWRTPGQGIAGYLAISPDTGEPMAYPGITLGASGIGLVLLAATSDVEPAWDSVFQLDL
jgi:lantibiotic biosynthesis protein